jgi:omega-6 fatty acid desaturase (delta-12 desaturase)
MTQSESVENRSEGKSLVSRTKPYTTESRAKSIWFTVTSFAILAAAIAFAVRPAMTPLQWAARAAASLVGGLVIVRCFILYHDYWHGAILRRSKVAKVLFWIFGLIIMTPPKVWRDTHNYHHAHTAKIVGSNIGSYIMVTTAMWAKMTAGQRWMYQAIRHPLTIATGYFTIFMLGMGVSPFLRSPRKNWSAGFALLLNWTLTALIIWRFGFQVWVFAFFLPLAISMAMGAYLFYAQHNFPEMIVQPRESWSFERAALESSSYMEMGPLMAFFTGNIGLHHVHHLNPLIPFYRLPEAMAGIPELQPSFKTSLRLRDVAACFRQKLWDTDAGKMVGYPR